MRVILIVVCSLSIVHGYALSGQASAVIRTSPRLSHGIRLAAKAKKGGKKKTGGAKATKISPKGFGARVATPAGGKLLSESKYEALYEWLRTNPLTNLRKVAVAEFGGLRGVMALQDIGVGEEIVGIPATMAVDIGSDARDPLPAAQRLLAARAAEVSPNYDPENYEDDESGSDERAAYWATLPPPDSPDLCTPDFYSEEQLNALQWPPMVEVAKQRALQLENAIAASSQDESCLQELRWAVWAVLSRVLTVQGPPDPGSFGGQPVGRKLLIPFIDMFNHKGGTKHYLTGRTDGMLRVVAGAPIKAGEQIFIMYGTEMTSNEEFVAHYGFHDPSAPAAVADRALVRSNVDHLSALGTTTEAEDAALLASQPPLSYVEQLPIRLRLSLKRAAREEGLL